VYYGNVIKVFPNPSSGYFHFEVEGLNQTVELAFEIIGGDGRVVQRGIASNYSGTVKGAFSLLHKPAGDYYLRFMHPSLYRLTVLVTR
jgi:hypothetical protein